MIERLRGLLAQATEGEWVVYSEPEVGLPASLFSGTVGHTGFGPIEPLQGADLELVAAMKTALPTLLDRLDELTADAEQSEKHRKDLADKVTVQSVEIGALKAEMERRDANEMRNCVNWGPCSRHDDSMTEGKLR